MDPLSRERLLGNDFVDLGKTLIESFCVPKVHAFLSRKYTDFKENHHPQSRDQEKDFFERLLEYDITFIKAKWFDNLERLEEVNQVKYPKPLLN